MQNILRLLLQSKGTTLFHEGMAPFFAEGWDRAVAIKQNAHKALSPYFETSLKGKGEDVPQRQRGESAESLRKFMAARDKRHRARNPIGVGEFA